MKVLITGGAGCLGANAAERVLAAGHEVAVLDNFATGRRDALAPHPALHVVEGSVADREAVLGLFRAFGPSHVIHAAAAYKDPEAWVEDVASNVLGTVNVLDASRETGVARLVYLQTALGYGAARQNPIPLGHPLQPTSSYAVSKTAGERYVAASGLSWVSLRLANVYGPRNFTGPVPAFYKRLKAGQPCTIVRTRRDFLALDDFLRLLDAALEPDGPTGPFNVARGRDCTIEEVYALMVRALGLTDLAPPEVRDPGGDDLASLLLDPSETERAFGWRPEVELEDGLSRAIAWYDAHGVGETFTHLQAPKR